MTNGGRKRSIHVPILLATFLLPLEVSLSDDVDLQYLSVLDIFNLPLIKYQVSNDRERKVD